MFSLEHSSSQQTRNFSGALLAASSHSGCLLAALVAAFFAYTQSIEIAWRIPFLLGSFHWAWRALLKAQVARDSHMLSSTKPCLFISTQNI